MDLLRRLPLTAFPPLCPQRMLRVEEKKGELAELASFELSRDEDAPMTARYVLCPVTLSYFAVSFIEQRLPLFSARLSCVV